MSEAANQRPWLDVLNRKHECGPSLSPYRTIEVTHRGELVRVRIPDNLHDRDRLEMRATLVSGPLLALIGHHTMKGDDPYERGIFMLARAAADGVYVVHVWHEMYPWALGHLGLENV